MRRQRSTKHRVHHRRQRQNPAQISRFQEKESAKRRKTGNETPKKQKINYQRQFLNNLRAILYLFTATEKMGSPKKKQKNG